MSHSSPTPDLSQSTVESPADDNTRETAFDASTAHESPMDDALPPSDGFRARPDTVPLAGSQPGLIDAIGNFVHERPLAVAAGAFLAGWLLAKSRGGSASGH